MSRKMKSHYGAFILAAAVYLAGVVSFSFWSYSFHHRSLLTHENQTLLNATISASEIHHLKSASKNDKASYVVEKSALRRIATQGNLFDLGIIHVKQKSLHVLIAESCVEDPLVQKLREDQPVYSALNQAILQLVGEANTQPIIKTIQHPVEGEFRYVLFYKPTAVNDGFVYFSSRKNGYVEDQLNHQLFRIAVAGSIMLLLVILLVIIFRRTQRFATRDVVQMNQRLKAEIDLQKSKEAELKDAINDLERFNAVSAGRETRIIELKAEVNELLQQLNRSKRYNIDKID